MLKITIIAVGVARGVVGGLPAAVGVAADGGLRGGGAGPAHARAARVAAAQRTHSPLPGYNIQPTYPCKSFYSWPG